MSSIIYINIIQNQEVHIVKHDVERWFRFQHYAIVLLTAVARTCIFHLDDIPINRRMLLHFLTTA